LTLLQPGGLTENRLTGMNGYRGYLELVRPANVVTAVADVLAGYAVAGLGNPGLGWLLLSTAGLYSGGVVLNDVFDRHLDRIERPERPIPSGRVSAGTAAGLGLGLLAIGVVAASLANRGAGMVAGATAACILVYDAWGKRQGLLGPINMGLCRGLNLLLGIAAAPAMLSEAWPLALLPLVYITAVTAVSRGEVYGGTRGVAGFALLSLSLVLMALLGLALRRGGGSWAGVGFALVLAGRVLPAFWGVYRTPGPGPIRHAIRTGVLSLVLLDAAIGATYGGALYSLVILATGLVAASLARLFAVT
jgi:4-hydroxybenzoate polyprenyltransferase